ncbi:MAG: glutamate mutase L [Anaerolineae bacterium]|nr:glutamate mutase L [Anaerolineae bacterium]
MADGSILAADFGNVLTRVILIDLVDGVYRLVARGETRSTGDFPVGDARYALVRVAEQITNITGRKLLDDKGRIITPEQPDRSGVDTFLATASTGRSLRTALVGLVPEVSIASGLRAAAGTYVDIVETLTLDDMRSEEDQLNSLVISRPDLIFITGGTEGGAQEPVLKLARLARLAIRLLGSKPVVLYAGNSVIAPQIRALFDGITKVFISPNVRPALEKEELEAAQLQLGLAFDEQQASKGGFGALGSMSKLGVLPTAQSYNLITDYLGKSLEGNVLAVDVGSAVSTLSASVNGRINTTIRTDVGLGHSAQSLLALAGETALKRWLPFVSSSNQIVHYALNKSLRPGTIPETLKGLYIEHALLREGIAELLRASRPSWTKGLNSTAPTLMPAFNLIIGAGSALTRTGNAGYSAMLLMDSLQPTGLTTLVADPYGLIAALGALAHLNPEAVVQVLEGGSLERLGTVVNISGQPAPNRPALKVKITTEDGEVIKQDVMGGHLWVYPLSVGMTVRLDVRVVGRGLTIGGKSRVRMDVDGGSAGLIFDARGRPLPLAVDVRGRAAQLPMWIAEMTGDPQVTIEESWLTSPEEEPGAVDMAEEVLPKGRRGRRKTTPAQPGGRRGLFGRGKAAEPDADGMPVIDLNTDDEAEEEDFQSALDELRRK